MGMPSMRKNMAQGPAKIEALAFATGWGLVKELSDKSDEKGRFRGYTRSSVSDRPLRQARNKAWNVSRKVQRGRTRRRYARNKSRGNIRPAMRRQLGAGGKRSSTNR